MKSESIWKRAEQVPPDIMANCAFQCKICGQIIVYGGNGKYPSIKCPQCGKRRIDHEKQ